MRQKKNFIRSLLMAGFIVLCGVQTVNLSHAEIPVPAFKPTILEENKVEEEVLNVRVSPLAPIPAAKPSKAKITLAPFEPNNKKIVVTADAGLKIIDDDLVNSKERSFYSDRQARLSQEIFDLQTQGKIEAANNKILTLKNSLLLGHIFAERYLHPTAYDAHEDELVQWMKKYSDHPQASQIYKLALKKNPALKNSLNKPQKYKRISGNLSAISQQGKLYKTTKNRSNDQNSRVRKLKNNISKEIKKQRLTAALHMLSTDYAVQFMDDVEYDHQRSLIAAGYMYAGKYDDALRLAKSAMKRSGSHVPMAGWVMGLVEWQNGNYRDAATGFQSAASSQYASGWLMSASAYWASRAHMRGGNTELVSTWLKLAATYPRTFYGLIATRALGHDSQFNWSLPVLNREDVKVVESTKQGKRAAALIQSNQHALATMELKNLSFDDDVQKKKSLLAYATKHHLPSLMMALGNSFSGPRGEFYDGALYPYAAWSPKEGFIIDKALMYAFIRQESRFNQRIRNPSGATGLMQLMPNTANHVSGQEIYQSERGKHLLQDPALNISLGQKYIKELLDYNSVDQDLISLAVAYNAGPGNLSKWKAERSHIDDPLLFIETIPYPETRAFVERVIANYWIYKMRMEEPTPSLDAVAEGKWAVRVARNN